MDETSTIVANWAGWSTFGAILKWAVWPAIVAGFVSWRTTKATINSQAERLRREFQFELATETAIRALLNDGTYSIRSFDKIKYHLHGFDDDNELRRYLIRAGAVRFTMNDSSEGWGLLDKHKGQAFK
ncbi:hypothetical protein [Sphingopyxis panaciterrae]